MSLLRATLFSLKSASTGGEVVRFLERAARKDLGEEEKRGSAEAEFGTGRSG